MRLKTTVAALLAVCWAVAAVAAPVRPSVLPPSDLALDRRTMTLTWKTSAPGAKYTVLRNRRSAPTYETLAEHLEMCSFTDGTARFPDEDYIAYKVISDAGSSAFMTFSRATELEKLQYLNMFRARGGVEKGAPWLPTTKPPEKLLEDIR